MEKKAKLKKTPWFNPETKPVRSGTFKVSVFDPHDDSYEPVKGYCYWDNDKGYWGTFVSTKFLAESVLFRGWPGASQFLYWKGVLRD